MSGINTTPPVEGRRRVPRILKRTAAALAVAAAAAGLAYGNNPDSNDSPKRAPTTSEAPATTVPVEIGEPLVIERKPTTTEAATTTVPVKIGEASVLERTSPGETVITVPGATGVEADEELKEQQRREADTAPTVIGTTQEPVGSPVDALPGGEGVVPNQPILQSPDAPTTTQQ